MPPVQESFPLYAWGLFSSSQKSTPYGGSGNQSICCLNYCLITTSWAIISVESWFVFEPRLMSNFIEANIFILWIYFYFGSPYRFNFCGVVISGTDYLLLLNFPISFIPGTHSDLRSSRFYIWVVLTRPWTQGMPILVNPIMSKYFGSSVSLSRFLHKRFTLVVARTWSIGGPVPKARG